MSGALDFPDTPALDESIATPKGNFVWKENPGRWRRDAGYRLASLDPEYVMVFGTTHTIEVNGAGFTADSEVVFNGAVIDATFVSSSRLTITVPGNTSWLAFDVWVVDPVKGETNRLPFEYRDYFVLSVLAPAGAAINLPQTFSALGMGFTQDSVVLMDSVVVPSTYVSAYELSVQAPLSTTIKTSVVTVTEGGLTSDPKNFQYIALPPPITLTLIQPNPTTTNDVSHSCIMTGTGFTSDCVVQWGSTLIVYPTITSATEMNCVMPVSDTVKTVQVYIKGIGRQSNAVDFGYTSATAPTLTVLTPDSILSDSGTHTVTLQGSNFDPDAKVWWDGVLIPSTWVAATRIDVSQKAPVVGTTKNVPVAVENPDTAELSNTVNFIWKADLTVPILGSLVPNYMVSYFSGEWEVIVQAPSSPGTFTPDAICYIDEEPQRTVPGSGGSMFFYCIGSNWPRNESTGYKVTVRQAGGISNAVPFYCVG